MQVSSNNILRLLSDIDTKKVETQKEINQCNASLVNIDKQLKNSHLSRITKGKLLENQVQLIKRLEQLEITLIKLNTLAQSVIARQNAPQVAQVPALQNRVTVALPVPTPIQEIEEESTEKEEIRENQVEIVEGQENSSETAIPAPETEESRESAKALNKAKSSAPSAFENSHSITDLFSRVQRAFFYLTGIDSRTLFGRCSYFNQTLFRGMCLWFGAFGFSAAAYFLFFNRGAALGSFVSKVNVLPVVSAGGQAVATSVASVVSAGVQAVATSVAPAVSSRSSRLAAIFALASSTELKAQYDAVHKLLRYYLKDRGHTLSWCYKHGKITLELFWYIVLNGLMKKHWHQSFEIPK